MAQRTSGMNSPRIGRGLAIALLASSGIGCSMQDSLLHRGTKAPAPFGSEMETGRGQSSTMGVDLSKLRPGEKAPDPVPGSSLW